MKAILLLIPTFFIQFLKANLSVAWIVLFRNPQSLHPLIVKYPTPELSNTKQALLAHMITLTPGTITCEINQQDKYLMIHLLDGQDAEASLKQITQSFKSRLVEVGQ